MFPSLCNLKLSSKIEFTQFIQVHLLADFTVHDSQHAGRQMLHLSTEIEILAQSPGREMPR